MHISLWLKKKEEKNNYMYFFHLWQNRFRQSKVLMCLQVPPALFDFKWISTLLVRQRRDHKILPFFRSINAHFRQVVESNVSCFMFTAPYRTYCGTYVKGGQQCHAQCCCSLTLVQEVSQTCVQLCVSCEEV